MLSIAADEGDRPELEPLGHVHRADRNRIGREIAVGRKPPAGEIGLCKGWFRALADKLSGPPEDCDLPWLDVARTQVAQPAGERGYLVIKGLARVISGSGPRRIDIVWRVSSSPSTSASFAGNSASEKRRIAALVR